VVILSLSKLQKQYPQILIYRTNDTLIIAQQNQKSIYSFTLKGGGQPILSSGGGQYNTFVRP